MSESPELQRVMENYNPISGEIHAILWLFRKTETSLEYKFQTWLTEDRFINNQRQVEALSFGEVLKGTELDMFSAENSAVLAGANSAVIPIVESLIGGNYSGWMVNSYEIDVEELIFQAQLSNADGRVVNPKCSDIVGKFTAIREQYQTIFDAVGFACLVRAARRHQFYKQLFVDMLDVLIANSEGETKAFYENILASFEE